MAGLRPLRAPRIKKATARGLAGARAVYWKGCMANEIVPIPPDRCNTKNRRAAIPEIATHARKFAERQILSEGGLLPTAFVHADSGNAVVNLSAALTRADSARAAGNRELEIAEKSAMWRAVRTLAQEAGVYALVVAAEASSSGPEQGKSGIVVFGEFDTEAGAVRAAWFREVQKGPMGIDFIGKWERAGAGPRMGVGGVFRKKEEKEKKEAPKTGNRD